MTIDWLHLLAVVVVCEVLGASGAIFTATAIPTWYANLKKPSFNPPNWIFGPVWTLLYALQGIALFIVLQVPGHGVASALFSLQFALNIGWTPLFFGMKKLGVAFIEIVFMFALIVASTAAFFIVNAMAGWLMVPYIAWVGFAALLNYEIWKLN